jgi:hypothetical protein
MSSIDARTSYAMMTQGYDFITRGINAGRPSKESKEAIAEREAEEERKTISPTSESRMQTTYNSKGQLIQYLDIASQINIRV